MAQQYGMTLNRRGRWSEAKQVITTAVADHGADAETLGILGRIHGTGGCTFAAIQRLTVT